VFIHDMKPLEAEILVAEVGHDPSEDQLFHILYDGAVVDEKGYTVLGGEADAIGERLKEGFREDWSLADALKATTSALTGPDRTLEAGDLEVAVLERAAERRAFRRIDDGETTQLLA
jgi:proteasome alpha subunit